jgi:hypothetical protein
VHSMTNKLIEYDDALLPELISPQGLLVADAYLQNGQDAKKTALALQVDEQEVRRLLKTPEVRSYTNSVFMETGFRNRHRMFGALDEIINRKLEEMEETGTTTEADILELMVKYHGMKMAEMKMEKELHEAKSPTIGKQNNVQVNIGSGDSNYDNLIATLAKGG